MKTVNWTTPLSELMAHYAEASGMDVRFLRFSLDKEGLIPLNPLLSPQELQCRDFQRIFVQTPMGVMTPPPSPSAGQEGGLFVRRSRGIDNTTGEGEGEYKLEEDEEEYAVESDNVMMQQICQDERCTDGSNFTRLLVKDDNNNNNKKRRHRKEGEGGKRGDREAMLTGKLAQANLVGIGRRRFYTSRYRGIAYEREVNKWRATAVFQGMRVYIGRYKTEEEAWQALCTRRKELGMPPLPDPDDIYEQHFLDDSYDLAKLRSLQDASTTDTTMGLQHLATISRSQGGRKGDLRSRSEAASKPSTTPSSSSYCEDRSKIFTFKQQLPRHKIKAWARNSGRLTAYYLSKHPIPLNWREVKTVLREMHSTAVCRSCCRLFANQGSLAGHIKVTMAKTAAQNPNNADRCSIGCNETSPSSASSSLLSSSKSTADKQSSDVVSQPASSPQLPCPSKSSKAFSRILWAYLRFREANKNRTFVIPETSNIRSLILTLGDHEGLTVIKWLQRYLVYQQAKGWISLYGSSIPLEVSGKYDEATRRALDEFFEMEAIRYVQGAEYMGSASSNTPGERIMSRFFRTCMEDYYDACCTPPKRQKKSQREESPFKVGAGRVAMVGRIENGEGLKSSDDERPVYADADDANDNRQRSSHDLFKTSAALFPLYSRDPRIEVPPNVNDALAILRDRWFFDERLNLQVLCSVGGSADKAIELLLTKELDNDKLASDFWTSQSSPGAFCGICCSAFENEEEYQRHLAQHKSASIRMPALYHLQGKTENAIGEKDMAVTMMMANKFACPVCRKGKHKQNPFANRMTFKTSKQQQQQLTATPTVTP
eukprot:jgi/Bigna1/144935/aug1.93_g19643